MFGHHHYKTLPTCTYFVTHMVSEITVVLKLYDTGDVDFMRHEQASFHYLSEGLFNRFLGADRQTLTVSGISDLYSSGYGVTCSPLNQPVDRTYQRTISQHGSCQYVDRTVLTPTDR